MGQSHTDDRIRLALVITGLEPGGAERCLTNLAIGLNRNRFAPVVYSLAPRPSGERGQLVKELEEAGVPVRFVGATEPWQFFSARRRLTRLLAEQAPHVVQTFLFHANVLGTLAAKHAGVKRVVTNIRVADPSCWRQRVEAFATRRVERVVCVSQSVANFARQKMGFGDDRLVVIPNGIDVSAYPARQAADLRHLRISEGRQIIVCIGRLDKQKGMDWLLKLAPRLFDSLPTHDLLLVGSGPGQAKLEAIALSLGIQAKVHFAGWQSDVKAILRAADLLVLPSRWEGMPNVLLEAMASGLPIVATQVEGVNEILGPLAIEQTVPPRDDTEFCAKVLAILKNVNLANDLGRRNRERVEVHFSLATMIGAYERLYESTSPKRKREGGEPLLSVALRACQLMPGRTDTAKRD